MGGGIGFGIKVAGNAFRILEQAAKTANKRIMAVVKKSATRVQRGAKINVHQKLNTTGLSTGGAGLSGSIGIKKDPSNLAADIGPSKIYGRIHEFGGVIRPKKGQFLSFISNQGTYAGQRVFVRSVTIPKRPYLQPALDDAKPKIERDFRALVGDLLEE